MVSAPRMATRLWSGTRQEAEEETHWRAYEYKTYDSDFPGGAVVKNLPANAGDTGTSPGPGRSHMLQSNEARAP